MLNIPILFHRGRQLDQVPLAGSSTGSCCDSTAALGGHAADGGFGVKPRENEEGRDGIAAPRSGSKRRPDFWRAALVTVAVGLGAAATLTVQGVRAAGIPATGSLTYSGQLSLADGSAVNGTKNIGIAVYNALTNGNRVCDVTSAPVSVVSGRFQVTLPDACVAAFKATPDLWVEIQVDGGSVGRNKLGVVPFAIEAAHSIEAERAISATTAASATAASSAAAATGALNTRIGSLEAKVVALEARKKVFSGVSTFVYGNCATVATPCSIDISAGGFGSAPNCTITVTNIDNTGYTEHMVIQSVSPTELKVWRGQYYQPYGTTMVLHYVCAGS